MTLQLHGGKSVGTRDVVIRINVNHNEANLLAELFIELGWEEVGNGLDELSDHLERELVSYGR